jgi:hypothetical protein
MAKAAAAAALFDKQIGKSGKSTDSFGRDLSKAEGQTNRLSGTLSRSTRELDSYSGRLGILASSIGAIGPAAVPITAVAIPAVTGLAQQLGLAALAGGTAVLAFQGVGDALTAMNKAHLEPTAANLEKAREAMERLSPAAQGLVLKLESMRGELGKLKDAAGSGILPGATAALDDLEKRLPIVERILHQVSLAVGDALRDGAASLAGPEWDKFFKFIATEARPELTKLAKSVGNVAHGLAEMWIAFGPLNSDFSSWMLKASRDFNSWATGLSKTQGFQEFVAYIRENGPKVGDALGAIGNALLQVVEAAAPIGGPILDALSAVADIVAAIADSDMGTPIFTTIAAFSALSLVTKAWSGLATTSAGAFIKGQVGAAQAIGVTTKEMINLNAVNRSNVLTTAGLVAGNAKVAGSFKSLGKGAAVMGGLALVSSGATEKIGLTNTAMLGLAGSMAGPWGAAAGAGVGLVLDFANVQGAASRQADALAATLDDQTGALTRNTRELVFNNLEKSGAIDAAKELGISLSVLQGAAEGSATDLAAVNAVLDDIGGNRGVGGRSADPLGLSKMFGDDKVKAANKVRDAVSDNSTAMSLAKGKAHDLGLALDHNATGPTSRAARAFDDAARATERFQKAVSALDRMLDKRGALNAYKQSVLDLKKTIHDEGADFRDTTVKGLRHRDMLDQIAKNAETASQKLGPLNKQRVLREAIDDLKEFRGKSDSARAYAQPLIDKLKELEKLDPKINVAVENRDALRSLKELQAQLSALHDKHIAITVSHGNSTTVGADPNLADGGHVRGPGGPRDDMIPARLSNGEFVVNANATARNLPLLHSINAQRFADGGLATYTSRRDRSYGERAGGQSASRIAVDLGDLRVVGTLNTPWGPATVEGIARAAARSEVSDSAALGDTHARMYTGGGERG